jgi:D-amino peptidase
MKVYLSADIEGVTGTTHWNETYMNKPEYAEFREQMTAEVSAACEGALSAGAEEVWVQDAHGEGRNIIASKLPERTRLIRGWSGHPFSMVQELDESFQAACMVGYHSEAGSDTNPLAHSMTTVLTHIKINGDFASEFSIHTFAGASVGVPTVFLSGDEGACDQAKALVPEVVTVGVKKGVGGSTVSLHPAVAVKRIREGMEKALSGDLDRYKIGMPERFSLEMGFKDHPRAKRASFYPGASASNPFTVLFEAEDYFDVLRFFQFALY